MDIFIADTVLTWDALIMSNRLLSPAAFFIVLIILMFLTILTVGLSFVPGSGIGRIIIGESIAVVKAAFVVLFFMHALQSTAQTRTVIVVTIFWFVVVLMSLTFTDYFTRGAIPNMPGH